MNSKYQEAINELKYALVEDTKVNWSLKEKGELVNILEALLEEYKMTDEAYNCRLQDFFIYKKALDKACELLADCEKDSCYYCPLKEGCIIEGQKNPAYQGLLKDETYRECNKEDWKKYLLRESNEKV